MANELLTEVITDRELNAAIKAAGIWIASRTGKIKVHNITFSRSDHIWLVSVFYFPLVGLEEPEYVDHDISEDSSDH